jgi:hypothetical protein
MPSPALWNPSASPDPSAESTAPRARSAVNVFRASAEMPTAGPAGRSARGAPVA